jgi:hypothetical protein
MGVRRLTAADHTEVLALFGKEADHYHFLLDDLKWNGYAGEQFLVFGELESGRLVSLLLNNFNNLTYYSPDDREPKAYRHMLGKLSFAKVSGPDRLVQRICKDLTLATSTLSHMGMVKQAVPLSRSPDTIVCAITAREELREQYRLLLSAEEYAGLSGDEEGYVSREWNRLASSHDRTVYPFRWQDGCICLYLPRTGAQCPHYRCGNPPGFPEQRVCRTSACGPVQPTAAGGKISVFVLHQSGGQERLSPRRNGGDLPMAGNGAAALTAASSVF